MQAQTFKKMLKLVIFGGIQPNFGPVFAVPGKPVLLRRGSAPPKLRRYGPVFGGSGSMRDAGVGRESTPPFGGALRGVQA